MNNLVSIVVPLYNYKRYIEENIKSIMSQSYADWEIVIVDDASSDNPYSVIKKYVGERIKYIKFDTNKGYSAAKNAGIRESSGSFTVVLDADDMLAKDSLQYRVEYLNSNPEIWVHGKALEFHNNKPYEFKFVNRKSCKRFKKIKNSGNYSNVWTCIHAQTVMVKREAYEKVGLYEVALRSMGDKEMWARLLHHVGRPGYIDKPIALYRQHDKQMHRSKKKLMNVPKLEKLMRGLVKKRKKNLKGAEVL